MERIGLLAGNMVKGPKKPLRVAVTGAAGNIGYALVFMIAQGAAFGPDQPVELSLIELPAAEKAMLGTEMELRDAALPLLTGIRCSTSAEEGFKDADYVVLVGAKPRTKGMERKDLLQDNAMIFKSQAEALDKAAKPSTRVLVVGNPANTNAAIIASISKKLDKRNITALTRLDLNRLVAQVALKTGVPNAQIRNGIIWGNHSLTQYPDVRYLQVASKGQWSNQTLDAGWAKTELVPKVQKRGGEIIEARKSSSAASAAAAVCAHLGSWHNGTRANEHVSMAVWSNGNPYGVPDGLIFSFPVSCKNGNWEFVKNLSLNDEFSKKMIRETQNELIDELQTALAFLKKSDVKSN